MICNFGPQGDLCDVLPSLKEVIEKGKQANWQKPESSLCCGSRVWWHGFRGRWYLEERICIRRVRCSGCGKTQDLRPREMWPRFQVTACQMIGACRLRIEKKEWHKDFQRSRIRWWVRVAQKLIQAFGSLLEGIKTMTQRFFNRAPPLSRVWLTHQTVS